MLLVKNLRIAQCATPALIFLFLAHQAPAEENVKILDTGKQPGHYLVWDGEPILPLGDSVTQGWMECGTNFDYEAYIDAVSAQGMNIVCLWSYIGTNAAGQTADTRIGYDAPEIWPWQGSPDDGSMDLTQFNQAYFDRLADFVSYAESKGVLTLITVHDGGMKWRSDCHPFMDTMGNGPLSSAEQYVELADYDNEMPETFDPSWTWQQQNQYFQERFADKLITELEPYSNVIFEMFNEGEWYDRAMRKAHEAHFLDFFSARTDSLLMSNIEYIFTKDEIHQYENVDLVSLHGDWTGRYDTFVDGFERTPPKPYFQSEPVPEYDGVNVGKSTVRRSVWERAMAGAGWEAQNDTSFGWDPNTGMADLTDKRDTAYEVIGYAATFFNDLGVEFWNMAPSPTLSSTGVVLADPETEYVVYAISGGTFTVDLTAAPGKTFEAQWLNPRKGELVPAGTISGGSADTSFTASNTMMWILWLKAIPVEGDLDGDGFVGSADLDIVRHSWGQAVSAGDLFQGDPSGDGLVDSDDLDIIRANWGAGIQKSAAVPEPSSAILLLASAAAVLLKRSRSAVPVL